MRLLYVTNARIPTEWAHSLQIMKTCEALAHAGADLALWTPAKKLYIKESPFSYYNVKELFPIQRFFTIDWPRLRGLGFILQTLTFALSVRLGLLREPVSSVIYCRDEMVVALLASLGVRNLVWESHDGVWNRWAKSAARSARHLVVVSHGLKDFYVENGVASEKITVIPNGIGLEEFAQPEVQTEARTRLGLPQDKKIALYIGMLEGWKGVDTLLAAAPLLSPDTLVVIIGGEDDALVARLAKEYPLIRFLGFRPQRELADNQAAADVLILPNTGKSEIGARFSSPLKLLSYMASSKPIVASDLPSVRELVDDKSAYLVRSDDPAALAEGIKTALAHSEQSAARAKLARERVADYTWDARANTILCSLSLV